MCPITEVFNNRQVFPPKIYEQYRQDIKKNKEFIEHENKKIKSLVTQQSMDETLNQEIH